MLYNARVKNANKIQDIITEHGLTNVFISKAKPTYFNFDGTKEIAEILWATGEFDLLEVEQARDSDIMQQTIGTAHEVRGQMRDNDGLVFDGGPEMDVVNNTEVWPGNGTPRFKYWHKTAISDDGPLDSSSVTHTIPDDAGDGVDIYIIDSGVNKDHPDLVGKILSLPGSPGDTDPTINGGNYDYSTSSHGTICSMFAAGSLTGSAPGAQLYAVSMDTPSGILGAFDAVLLHHNTKANGRPSVVSMSWSFRPSTTYPYYQTDEPDTIKPLDVLYTDFIKTMHAVGIHTLSSAGNGFLDKSFGGAGAFMGPMLTELVRPAYMSSYSPHMTIGSTNNSNDTTTPNSIVSGFSNYGSPVTLFAPGHLLYGFRYDTLATDDPATWVLTTVSGTSFSTPMMAGVCAHLLQYNPAISPAVLKEKIVEYSAGYSVVPGTFPATDGILLWQSQNPSANIMYRETDTSPTTFEIVAIDYNAMQTAATTVDLSGESNMYKDRTYGLVGQTYGAVNGFFAQTLTPSSSTFDSYQLQINIDFPENLVNGQPALSNFVAAGDHVTGEVTENGVFKFEVTPYGVDDDGIIVNVGDPVTFYADSTVLPTKTTHKMCVGKHFAV